MKKRIYADHAATTKLSDKALEAMMPFLQEAYQNPSTLYASARHVRRAIAEARAIIAESIGANPKEIIFTSGGTESDNWAIKGIAWRQLTKKQIVTTAFEHHAILNSCRLIQDVSGRVTYILPNDKGMIEEKSLLSALKQDTSLVSVMLVNNEIGTIQRIRELSEVAHNKGALFHTDAVQAVGHIPVNVETLGVDLLSASAHKFNGPKGIGFLYMRDGIELLPYINGGGQEGGRRSGTENVVGIVGMAAALKENVDMLEDNMKQLAELEHLFINKLKTCKADYLINGVDNRILGNISVSFKGLDGEAILHRMDLKGIEIATGSACDSKDTQISHVLTAIGLSEEYAKGTVRISLGAENTKEEVDVIVTQLIQIVESMNESR
jgi:cysteine desulfurase